MANDERPVVMTIPEDMMRATIQAAVASALANGDPNRFIRELVQNVLSRKATDSGNYQDRDKTIMDLTVRGMVEKLAKEFCAEYVESLRPQIKQEVETRLKNKKKFASEIADKLVEAITGNVRASILIEVKSKEGY